MSVTAVAVVVWPLSVLSAADEGGPGSELEKEEIIPVNWEKPISTGAGYYYYDADSDGYGAGAASWHRWRPSPKYYSEVRGDCEPLDAAINPGATEVWYDGVDQNCDGASDYDQDADGEDSDLYGGTDCDDTNADVYVGATDAWYDGVDANCDGASDYDQDGDGYESAYYYSGGTDCNDHDATSHPAAGDEYHIDTDGDGLYNCVDGDLYADDFSSETGAWTYPVDFSGSDMWYTSGRTGNGSWAVDLSSEVLYESSSNTVSGALVNIGPMEYTEMEFDMYINPGTDAVFFPFGYQSEDEYYVIAWGDPTGYYETTPTMYYYYCSYGTCTASSFFGGAVSAVNEGEWLSVYLEIWDDSDLILTITDEDGTKVIHESEVYGSSSLSIPQAHQLGFGTVDANGGGVWFDNVDITTFY